MSKEIGFDLATAPFLLNQGKTQDQVSNEMGIDVELLRQALENLGEWKVRTEAFSKFEIGTIFLEHDGPYRVFDRHDRYLSFLVMSHTVIFFRNFLLKSVSCFTFLNPEQPK